MNCLVVAAVLLFGQAAPLGFLLKNQQLRYIHIAQDGPAHTLAFQQDAQVEMIPDGGFVDAHHHGAPVHSQLQQTLAGQGLKRLPHGSPGNPQLCGNFRQAQLVAGLIFSCHQRFAQDRCHPHPDGQNFNGFQKNASLHFYSIHVGTSKNCPFGFWTDLLS